MCINTVEAFTVNKIDKTLSDDHPCHRSESPTFQRPSLASERLDFGSQLMWMIAPRDFII